jgi:predicted RNA-binding Zn ribbon-like protein
MDPGRDHDVTPAAPEGLELVQRFMNLHAHGPGSDDDRPPTLAIVRSFLVSRQLLRAEAPFGPRDHERALALHRALHAKVRANAGEPVAPADLAVIEDVAERAALRPRFDGIGAALVPTAEGVDGALGRLVADVFLAEVRGTWTGLKECDGDGCTSVFYDRSKNHTGRWCSMAACGNRAKVRAWRERQRAAARG